MSLIRICVSDDFTVDYDKDREMYRVSIFKDNHFIDEYWFDCYEEKELSKKEVPMRVRREKYFYGTIPYCPVCDNKLTEWASKMLCDNYCRVCGQALDWGEDNV